MVVGGIRVVVNADVIVATLVVVVVGTENHNLFGSKRFYLDFCYVIITQYPGCDARRVLILEKISFR